MSIVIAEWTVRIVGLYLALGLVVALPFVIKGAQRVDPAAREGTWGFRVLIFPGAVALWPLLLKRWLGGTDRPPAERNAHRDASRTAKGTAKQGASQ